MCNTFPEGFFGALNANALHVEPVSARGLTVCRRRNHGCRAATSFARLLLTRNVLDVRTTAACLRDIGIPLKRALQIIGEHFPKSSAVANTTPNQP